MDYGYTLIFIRYGDEVLLINREKGSWMGRWNGLGGKIEKGETALRCAIRETEEESGLRLNDFVFCGSFTWENKKNAQDKGNIACYYAFTNDKIPTPFKYREGILDWKKLDWILSPKNLGVAENLPLFIPYMFKDEIHKYHCVYDGLEMIDFQILDQVTQSPFLFNQKSHRG